MRRLLLVVRRLLVVVSRVLFVVCCAMAVVCWLLCLNWLLSVVRCAWFVVFFGVLCVALLCVAYCG